VLLTRAVWLSSEPGERSIHGQDCVVLYPDPAFGYPPKYLRDSMPSLRRYPDSQSSPTLGALDLAGTGVLSHTAGSPASSGSSGLRRSESLDPSRRSSGWR
jgi:hypothetical protein